MERRYTHTKAFTIADSQLETTAKFILVGDYTEATPDIPQVTTLVSVSIVSDISGVSRKAIMQNRLEISSVPQQTLTVRISYVKTTSHNM